jgi:hypothetical protein
MLEIPKVLELLKNFWLIAGTYNPARGTWIDDIINFYGHL